jgi:DNA end-binding protein Ku
MAIRGRDNLVAIKPCGDGLLLETLRYSNEVRASDKIFSDIPEIAVDKDMLELASELIERKSGAFEPEAFKSQYAKALRDLVEQKRRTGDVATASEENLKSRGQNVVDLMDALKKSVAQGKKSPAISTGRPSRRGRSITAVEIFTSYRNTTRGGCTMTSAWNWTVC